MQEIVVDNKNLIDLLIDIENCSENDISLKFDKGSLLIRFPVSMTVLEKFATIKGKSVKFLGADKTATQMLLSLNSEASPSNDTPVNIRNSSRAGKVTLLINPFLSFFKSLNKKLRNFFSASRTRLLIVLVVVPIILFSLFLVGFSYLKNNTKATVELTVFSDQIVQDLDFLGSVAAPEDSSLETYLPITLIEVSGRKQHKIDTTGTKTVGSKASGDVSIYNKTSTEKTFKAGTALSLITTEETIKFLLDEEIKVPARELVDATAETVEYRSGVATASAVAEKIGSSGNVNGGKNFMVSNESAESFVAINHGDFGGGESRQVKVVTSKDMEDALASSKALLLEESISQIRAKMISDQKLEQKALQAIIVNSSYNHDVDDEADSLSVTLDLKIKAGVYSEAVLKELAHQTLLKKIPDDYDLTDDPISVSVEDVSGSLDKGLYFSCRVKGFVIPRFKKETVAKSITSLSLQAAEEYLKSLRGISSIRITISSPIPVIGKLLNYNRLPENAQSISVNIVSQ